MESAGQVSRWIEDEQSDEYSYVLQGKTETFTLVLAWEMKPGADPNDPDMPAYITLDKINGGGYRLLLEDVLERIDEDTREAHFREDLQKHQDASQKDEFSPIAVFPPDDVAMNPIDLNTRVSRSKNSGTAGFQVFQSLRQTLKQGPTNVENKSSFSDWKATYLECWAQFLRSAAKYSKAHKSAGSPFKVNSRFFKVPAELRPLWAGNVLGWEPTPNNTVAAEWLHRRAHRFAGRIADFYKNVVFGSRECNTHMIRAENLINSLLRRGLDVKQSTLVTDQSHIYMLNKQCVREKFITNPEHETHWLAGELQYTIAIKNNIGGWSNHTTRFHPFSRYCPLLRETQLDELVLKTFVDSTCANKSTWEAVPPYLYCGALETNTDILQIQSSHVFQFSDDLRRTFEEQKWYYRIMHLVEVKEHLDKLFNYATYHQATQGVLDYIERLGQDVLELSKQICDPNFEEFLCLIVDIVQTLTRTFEEWHHQQQLPDTTVMTETCTLLTDFYLSQASAERRVAARTKYKILKGKPEALKGQDDDGEEDPLQLKDTLKIGKNPFQKTEKPAKGRKGLRAVREQAEEKRERANTYNPQQKAEKGNRKLKSTIKK